MVMGPNLEYISPIIQPHFLPVKAWCQHRLFATASAESFWAVISVELFHPEIAGAMAVDGSSYPMILPYVADIYHMIMT